MFSLLVVFFLQSKLIQTPLLFVTRRKNDRSFIGDWQSPLHRVLDSNENVCLSPHRRRFLFDSLSRDVIILDWKYLKKYIEEYISMFVCMGKSKSISLARC